MNPPTSDDPTICYCHAVRLSELLDSIRKGSHSLYDIQLDTLATTGCGGCECEVLEILQEELKQLKSKSEPNE